jgi:hypothetical protein
MNRNWVHILSILILLGPAARLIAQHSFFRPEGAFAIEISLSNTSLKRLPMYRNAITSLIVTGDHIVGGTTAREGMNPFVFVASLSAREMIAYIDIETVVPGQRSVHTGFVKGTGQQLYAGTMPGKNSEKDVAGGHILQIDIRSSGEPVVSDLGCPVPGEGIFSLICDRDDNKLYGIAHPSGRFFVYEITSGKVLVYDDLVPSAVDLQVFYDFAQEPSTYLGKKLIQDDKKRIYGSMPINKIFCFDPAKNAFKVLEDEIPEVWGRRTLGQIESWLKTPDGKLYGGNAGDGQLILLDPETKKMKNLGKPIMANGMAGMVFGKDGRLYGLAGKSPAETHLFTYSEAEGFKDLGNPLFEMKAPGIEQGIKWRAFHSSSITASEDGEYIVIGEDEDLSQLMVFRITGGE